MRLARGLLFVVAPTDPLTFGAVALLLLGVAVAGALVPAAKAAGIQPVEALGPSSFSDHRHLARELCIPALRPTPNLCMFEGPAHQR
jgi:hypothetical protein